MEESNGTAYDGDRDSRFGDGDSVDGNYLYNLRPKSTSISAPEQPLLKPELGSES
jgi:hypothetical protein